MKTVFMALMIVTTVLGCANHKDAAYGTAVTGTAILLGGVGWLESREYKC
jgi:hypothetical protein